MSAEADEQRRNRIALFRMTVLHPDPVTGNPSAALDDFESNVRADERRRCVEAIEVMPWGEAARDDVLALLSGLGGGEVEGR